MNRIFIISLLLLLLSNQISSQQLANITISNVTEVYCGKLGTCESVINNTIKNPKRKILTRGDTTLIYVRLTYAQTSNVGIDNSAQWLYNYTNITFSASMYPRVDEYTIMNATGTSKFVLQSDAFPEPPKVYVDLVVGNRIYTTRPVNWTIKSNGKDFVVPGRTVLVTLKEGVITYFDWAPTRCVLETAPCIDGISGVQCSQASADSGSCDISVRVAWAGTDSQSKPVKSSSLDLWRMANAF